MGDADRLPASVDGHRAAAAGLPGAPPRPGTVQGSAAHPGVGLRRLRPKSRRGPCQRTAAQAGARRPAGDPDGARYRLPVRGVKTGSLARRTVIATLGVLVLALGGFATLITLRYRDGLRARARSQLLAGARAITAVPQEQLKPLFASLALEGIDVQVGAGPPGPANPKVPRGAPVESGALSSGAHLLTLTEQISVGGKPAIATLSTSEGSVDSAVDRLIVTELVGAAAVLVAA